MQDEGENGVFGRGRSSQIMQSFKNRLKFQQRQEQQAKHLERMAQYTAQMDKETAIKKCK